MAPPAWLLWLVVLLVACQAPAAPPPDPNPIQIENALPGNSDWPITHASSYDPASYRYVEIEAFAAMTSAAPGQYVPISVSTAEAFTAEVYRLGFYGGAGARRYATLGPFADNKLRPLPAPAANSRLVDLAVTADAWPATFTLPVGLDWPSGLYLIRLTTSDSGAQFYVPLVVRSSGRRAPLVLLHSANTDQAYNIWGGTSLYVDLVAGNGGRATQVSFNRPYEQDRGAGQIFYWEYPALRYLEQQGFDVDYLSDVDVHQDATLLRQRAAVLITGHSEYWSAPMRDAAEAAVAAGVSLANLGGNDGYQQVRYEPSGGAADRIITCYKDADLDRAANPTVPDGLLTIPWRDPPINRPEQTLFGSMYVGAMLDPLAAPTRPLQVLAPGSWIFAGAPIPPDHVISAADNWLGWEMDAELPADRYAQASAVVVLTSMEVDTPAGAVASMTLYQAPSGAWVWSGGSMNWVWGLSDFIPAFAEYHARYQRAGPIAARMLQNFLATVQVPSSAP